MAKQLATEMAPPFHLVAHFMIAGGLFYALSAFIMLFFTAHLDSFFISTTIASITHLYLLGFVMMIIFGAMYQLVPVILEIPLFSKDFAYVQFYIYVVGLLLMSWGFFFEESYLPLLGYGALMVYISIMIFIVNIFLTYRNIEQWSIPAKFIYAANIFLLVGVTLGLLTALNMQYGFLSLNMLSLAKAHISAVLAGFLLMLITGVAMVLIPMFSLAHQFSQEWVEKGFNFIIAGVVLYILGAVLDVALISTLGTLFMLIATVLFILQMREIFKKRVRKEKEFWSENMVASFYYLIASLVILFIAFLTGYERLYLLGGFILFFGFFASIIIGHIYKILPFLVWYQRFSPLVGKQKVPMLHDMVDKDIAMKQYKVTLAGTIVTALGLFFALKFLFFIGVVLLIVGAGMVLYNIYYTLRYE